MIQQYSTSFTIDVSTKNPLIRKPSSDFVDCKMFKIKLPPEPSALWPTARAILAVILSSKSVIVGGVFKYLKTPSLEVS